MTEALNQPMPEKDLAKDVTLSAAQAEQAYVGLDDLESRSGLDSATHFFEASGNETLSSYKVSAEIAPATDDPEAPKYWVASLKEGIDHEVDGGSVVGVVINAEALKSTVEAGEEVDSKFLSRYARQLTNGNELVIGEDDGSADRTSLGLALSNPDSRRSLSGGQVGITMESKVGLDGRRNYSLDITQVSSETDTSVRYGGRPLDAPTEGQRRWDSLEDYDSEISGQKAEADRSREVIQEMTLAEAANRAQITTVSELEGMLTAVGLRSKEAYERFVVDLAENGYPEGVEKPESSELIEMPSIMVTQATEGDPVETSLDMLGQNRAEEMLGFLKGETVAHGFDRSRAFMVGLGFTTDGSSVEAAFDSVTPLEDIIGAIEEARHAPDSESFKNRVIELDALTLPYTIGRQMVNRIIRHLVMDEREEKSYPISTDRHGLADNVWSEAARLNSRSGGRQDAYITLEGSSTGEPLGFKTVTVSRDGQYGARRGQTEFVDVASSK